MPGNPPEAGRVLAPAAGTPTASVAAASATATAVRRISMLSFRGVGAARNMLAAAGARGYGRRHGAACSRGPPAGRLDEAVRIASLRQRPREERRVNTDVFITCAVTGAGDTTATSDRVPVRPHEIAQEAIEAARAGAAVAHIHVRD